MNLRATNQAGGYEPLAAATDRSTASAPSTRPDTQLADNPHAILREPPPPKLHEYTRASGRDQKVPPCELLRARSDRRRRKV